MHVICSLLNCMRVLENVKLSQDLRHWMGRKKRRQRCGWTRAEGRGK
jgi:hypothetical protein